MKGQTIAQIKYGLSTGSKIFTGMSLFNMLLSFLSGDGGNISVDTLNKFVISFVCIASVLVFERTKVNIWLKFLLSFLVVNALMQIYALFIGLWLDIFLHPLLHLQIFIWTAVIFVIAEIIEQSVERIKARKKEGNIG